MAGGDWIGYLRPDQFLDHLTVIKTKYRINIVSISYRMNKKRIAQGWVGAFAPPRGNLSHVTCIIEDFVYGHMLLVTTATLPRIRSLLHKARSRFGPQ